VKGALFGRCLNVCDLNQVAERLLNGALNGELHRGGEGIVCGRKNELKRAAPEGRPVHPFARLSEEHLLDEFANVARIVRRGSSAAVIKAKRVVEINGTIHMPMTRVWVPLITRGVPVGKQVAWLSISRIGAPSEVTRVAKLMNCAVTQGPPAGGGSVQPATT
jgi:hypothetical protein